MSMMLKRTKLRNFDKARQNAGDKLHEITIKTHVPEKWRFVDLETGDIWQWIPDKGGINADGRVTFRGHFKRADDLEILPNGY